MLRKRPGLLNLFIALMLLNAIGTGLHYILIYQGTIQIKATDMSNIKEFALADTIAVIIPSIIAAIGLWQLKAWGWVFAILQGGGYLYGLIVLLTQTVTVSQFGMMSYASVYFILFTIFMIVYLYQKRALFD